jgi:5-methylcytosine-specific restriction protein A
MPYRIPTFRPRQMPAKQRPTAAARGYCSAAWRRTRLAVIARDGGVCQLCGELVQGDDRDAHVDHVIEKAAGGGDELSNLRLVHRSCHSKRHASDRLGGRLRS